MPLKTKRQFVLHTTLSGEECIQRLRREVELNTSIDWFTSKPVIGKIRDYNFRLRKRTLYSNGFASYLYGQLEGDATGTRIVGRFRLHPLARFFVCFWFSGAVLLVLLCFFDSFGRTGPWEQTIHNCLIGLGVPLGGVVIYGVGRLLGRWGEPTLTQFLMRTLSAQPISAGS